MDRRRIGADLARMLLVAAVCTVGLVAVQMVSGKSCDQAIANVVVFGAMFGAGALACAGLVALLGAVVWIAVQITGDSRNG